MSTDHTSSFNESSFNDILVAKYEGVLTITIQRPEALNALRPTTLHEIYEAVENARKHDDIRVVVFTGAGQRSFVSGGDVKEMKDWGPLQAADFAEAANRVLNAIETLPKPTIAAVNGIAFGAGCDLSIRCDITIASENAVFGQPTARLGIVTTFGGTQRLPRLVGPKDSEVALYDRRYY